MDSSPIQQFNQWFNEAQIAEINEPNAMSLATVSKDNIPSNRTVLLKIFDENGFVFFTNYNSQKAQDIDSNPNVALLFAWLGLERQIRITGVADRKSTRLNSSHITISYAVFCLKKKNI